MTARSMLIELRFLHNIAACYRFQEIRFFETNFIIRIALTMASGKKKVKKEWL